MSCLFCDRFARWFVQGEHHDMDVCGRHLHTAVEINATKRNPATVHPFERTNNE